MSLHLNKLCLAINDLFENDIELFEVDINERSLTHKLAEYLQKRFPEFHVDCEYNRLGESVKRLPNSEDVRSDDIKGKSIFPDIIVHKRKESESNLLVIEVKKSGNNCENDKWKLQELTKESGDYSYKYGVQLIFTTNKEGIDRISIYHKGKESELLTNEIRLDSAIAKYLTNC